MKARDLGLLLAIALGGFLAGTTVVKLRAAKAPHMIVAPPKVSRSILNATRSKASQAGKSKRDQVLETRAAYHVPLEQISEQIDLYHEKGWWEGMAALFNCWAEQDPEAAFEKASTISWLGKRMEIRLGDGWMSTSSINPPNGVFVKIGKSWFARDPEAALHAYLKYADSQPKRPSNGLLESIALGRYLDRDPGKATELAMERMDWLGEYKIGNWSRGADSEAQHYFIKWSKVDPKSAAQRALTTHVEDRGVLGQMIGGVYKGWRENDREAAEAWIESLDSKLPLEEVEAAQIDQLAKTNPARAFAQSFESADSIRWSQQWSVLSKWMEKDGLATLEPLDAIANSEMVGHAVSSLFQKTGGADLGHAILGLPADRQQSPLATLGQKWGNADPPAAEAFADNIEQPIIRRAYLDQVYGAQAKANPAHFSPRLETIEDAALREGVASRLATAWAKRDQDAAASWYESLKPSPSKEAALRTLMKHSDSMRERMAPHDNSASQLKADPQ